MDTTTKLAVTATLHCLSGCAIGEITGMVIGSLMGMSNAGMIALSVVLAFTFGYALSMLPLARSGMELKKAFKLALAADTISILSMETIDNLFIAAVPGALDAGLTQWLFWVSLLSSLGIAFIVTVPVNRLLIKRGKGHALVHSMHHDHH
jgi:hypothetical protein